MACFSGILPLTLLPFFWYSRYAVYTDCSVWFDLGLTWVFCCWYLLHQNSLHFLCINAGRFWGLKMARDINMHNIPAPLQTTKPWTGFLMNVCWFQTARRNQTDKKLLLCPVSSSCDYKSCSQGLASVLQTWNVKLLLWRLCMISSLQLFLALSFGRMKYIPVYCAGGCDMLTFALWVVDRRHHLLLHPGTAWKVSSVKLAILKM